MDRALSINIIRQRYLRNVGWGVVLIVAVLTGLYFMRSSLTTSLNPKKFRTAVAEAGNIENTITAAGEVLPEFEQVITSSIQAEVEKVLLPVGSTVQPNEPILLLNKEFALLKKEKLNDELLLKKNSMVQLKLQLDKNIYDLKINNEIKDLRINGLQADLVDAQRLVKVGGGTEAAIEKIKLNLAIAQLEKKQLENDLKHRQQSVTSDLRAMELQMTIQQRAIKEFSRKLEQAEVVASRTGVLTWVNENIGTTVGEGDALARIAGLESFRIEGEISDIYSEKIHVGQAAIVRINEQDLRGLISNIKPTITNGVIQFVVQLHQPKHELLRPNLKVEVFLVTASKTNTIRVANGPIFKGRKQETIYVLEDGRAKQRKVKVGLTNFDYVEILDNLQAGEEVIITDMKDYVHLAEVAVSDEL
ncbi:MAG: HlyD family efflux transporter periplasmic adaptor subunit [Bacteroidota bacterium]